MYSPGHVPHLCLLSDALSSLAAPPDRAYAIPALWVDPAGPPGRVNVDPVRWFSDLVGGLLESEPVQLVSGRGGSWSDRAVVYNMIIRTTCAFDHDGDGTIDPSGTASGWSETGTCLKALAILPYLRSLGVNTIHLLPVFDIGRDGRRGKSGSPYAVRDFGAVDPSLSENKVDLSPDQQFRAFLEAAHRSGFRIVLEIPLRTVSKDSVWIADHPDWFYWIKEGDEFSQPVFPKDVLREIGEKVSRGEYGKLPSPDREYRARFFDPPSRDSVVKEGVRFTGRTPDGVRVVLPGAFADWPPNDTQPVWGDVTYLKYYQDPGYNYLAYNTLRMYDSQLTEGGTETTSLWEELPALVARFASEYHIDGVMIDMAHAIPTGLRERIIARGRAANSDLVFWAEDFARIPGQREAGYNAIMGDQWFRQHTPGDFRAMLESIANSPSFLPHLASPETHNTPRAVGRPGNRTFSRYAWILSNFIPALPCIHSGFELYESHPVNTGLGFTAEERTVYDADSLPLFSGGSLGWENPQNMVSLVQTVSRIREMFEDCFLTSYENTGFSLLEGGGEGIIAFSRSAPGEASGFLVAANSDMERRRPMRVTGGGLLPAPKDLIGEATFAVSGNIITGELEPGQVVLFRCERG